MPAINTLLFDRYAIGPRIHSPAFGASRCEQLAGIAHSAQDLDGRAVVLVFLTGAAGGDSLDRIRGLRHPNLLAIEAWGMHDGSPVIVLDPPPTRTLADVLVEAPMTDTALRQVVIDVLAGLGALHRAGVTCGRLRDHDILIADDGSARLDLEHVRVSTVEATKESQAQDLRFLGIAFERVLATGRVAVTRPELAELLAAVLQRAATSRVQGGFASAPDVLRALAGENVSRVLVPPPPTATAEPDHARPASLVAAKRPIAIAAAIIAIIAVFALLTAREGFRPPTRTPATVATIVETPTTIVETPTTIVETPTTVVETPTTVGG